MEDVSEREFLKILYANPVYHRCLLLLELSRIPKGREALDAIYYVVRDSCVIDVILRKGTFGVKSTRRGNHPFTSQEVASYAGAAVIDGCRLRRGFRPLVDLDDPQVQVVADVCGQFFFLGIELVGERCMHRRGWRVYEHPASLKSTIANALLMLAGFGSGESLWDPMCGGGTIPIEAAHRCMGLPPAYFRKRDFAFLRAGLFSERLWEEVTCGVDAEIRWDANFRIFASDASFRHLEGALRNAENALIKDKILFEVATVSCFSKKDEVDVVVTNPPYGIRMGGPKKARKALEELMQTFLVSSARVLVVIHPFPDMVKEIAQKLGIKLDKEVRSYNGNLEVSLLRFGKGG